jgi:hypothetical protein
MASIKFLSYTARENNVTNAILKTDRCFSNFHDQESLLEFKETPPAFNTTLGAQHSTYKKVIHHTNYMVP